MPVVNLFIEIYRETTNEWVQDKQTNGASEIEIETKKKTRDCDI